MHGTACNTICALYFRRIYRIYAKITRIAMDHIERLWAKDLLLCTNQFSDLSASTVASTAEVKEAANYSTTGPTELRSPSGTEIEESANNNPHRSIDYSKTTTTLLFSWLLL